MPIVEIKKPIILIVDDTPLNIKVLAEALMDEYSIKVASNGKQALETLEKEIKPDLILLDVMMPELDGIQVLHQLSQTSPKKPNGKIIILTNLSHDPTIQEGLSSGAASYLIKADITPDLLVDKIKEMLS